MEPQHSLPPRSPQSATSTRHSKNVVLTEEGRSPWYDANGIPQDAYVVGVAGGSASGKTSVAKAILALLPKVPWVGIVSQDSFYKSLTRAQSKLAFENNYNFDHPNAFDHHLLKECIADLKQSRAVEIPVYSFVEHQRMEEVKYMYGATVVIVEGIFILHDPEVRSLLDLKIYVQADSDLMLARRIRRDTVERGRDVAGILDQYLRFVKPSMDNFVSQTARFADIIVPGQNNEVAIDVISQQIWRQLRLRDDVRLRHELSRTPATPRRDVLQSPLDQGESNNTLQATSLQRPAYSSSLSTHSVMTATTMGREFSQQSMHPLQEDLSPNILLLPQTTQMQALLTILHDTTVTGEDFIFTVDRLSTLVMESAMSLLPYQSKDISILPDGHRHTGTELALEHICSVSILRSGSVLQSSARRVLPALSSGSLLIQSSRDGEAKLYTIDLPSFIKDRNKAFKSWVLILDSQIGTGAAALMAIRVLLDHGVQEDHLIFCCLLASAKGGVHALNRAFPKVKIVVAGVDPELKRRRVWDQNTSSVGSRSSKSSSSNAANGSIPHLEVHNLDDKDGLSSSHYDDDDRQHQGRICFAIEPGAGNIGDRYFGTKSKSTVTTLGHHDPP